MRQTGINCMHVIFTPALKMVYFGREKFGVRKKRRYNVFA